MSGQTKGRIFVTGGTGLVGSHVVYQLLEKGYPVRAAARGTKVALLKKVFASYDNFEVVDIPDMATADYSRVLHDVSAVIHVAAIIPGLASSETTFNDIVEGSLRIVRDAVNAGVRNIVYTGTMGTWNLNGPWGVDDWVPITKEEAIQGEWTAYIGGKKYAEIGVLEFAEAHPEVNITILSPSLVIGPFALGFEHLLPAVDYRVYSSNIFLHRLLYPSNNEWPFVAGIIDVRDMARALVAGLDAKPTSQVGRKRYPVISPAIPTSWKDAIKIVAEARPGLKHRLADSSKAPTLNFEGGFEVDRQGLERAVGIKPDSYISFRDTILDAVDSFVEQEKIWRMKGLLVTPPPGGLLMP